jgi:hypothetical protein
MGHPGSEMRAPSLEVSTGGERPRPWRIYLFAAVVGLLLWIGYDTLLNSAGDIRHLWLSYRIERYIDDHPGLSPGDRTDLRAGRVVRGWDREKCRVAWGKPDRVLNLTNMGAEIWHYGGGSIQPATLVFTNGILTDFGP